MKNKKQTADIMDEKGHIFHKEEGQKWVAGKPEKKEEPKVEEDE